MPQPKKIQTIALSYYARKDIQQAMFDFCKNRETIPRYTDGFGKRPDCFEYLNDIFNLAKQGATSFHCSEELWQNPLEINTDMTPEQYNEIKISWDFLIDIDSKYLDYSKIAAELIIKALEYNGVQNVGIKFSGSKGFHILIPFKAFPKQVGEHQTKDMFPEWARLIADYLKQMIKPELTKKILHQLNIEDLQKSGKELLEPICVKCGGLAIKQARVKYVCPACGTQMQSTDLSKKVLKCPTCRVDMEKIREEIIFVCNKCDTNSLKTPEQFVERKTVKQLIDSVDIVLVAPRHLFRAPYSLHEKTALASVVLDKEEVHDFKPSDADPLKIQIKDFMPECPENEASELLIQALDWAERSREQIVAKKFTGKSIDLKGLTITEDMYPDCIKKILLGIKQDGRKRALSLLLAFFSSLEFPREYIETTIEKWNTKNYKPLKIGYVKSQILWHMKNKRLPPNYDKPIYKELAILGDTAGVKNPINFTIREAMRAKSKKTKKKK